MNPLTYNMPGWWPMVAVSWIFLVVIIGVIFVRRSHSNFSPRKRIQLWLLRSLASGLLVLLILNWSSESVRTSKDKPLVHVLVDRSASMATRDAVDGMDRYAAACIFAKYIADKETRNVFASFAADLESGLPDVRPDGSRSAIGKALSRTLENSGQQAIKGVVLLSDFAASDDAVIQDVLKIYQTAKVPVFPWIIGSEKQPADVRIVSAQITQTSPSQPSLKLISTIDSPGYGGREVELRISCEGQLLATELIKLSGTTQKINMDFLSPFLGLNFYEVELAALPGETSVANNSVGAACELIRDPIRVLYMEGSAPSETSYLKNALESDPDIEVHSLHLPPDSRAAELRGRDTRLFQDGDGRIVPSVCHPSLGFPKNLEELLKYDVIILSDISKDAYDSGQISSMVAFVEEFGGGFVMVGGVTSFGAGGYEKTPIEKLMPIKVSDRSDPLWSGANLLRVAIPAGPLHPIMQIGETAEESRTAWTKTFPGFSGINYVKRAKPGALVIARTDLSYDQYAMQHYGRMHDLVLFAVQQIGRGRTMAFCSDTTTSWGDHFQVNWGPGKNNNRYYAKFWNNSIRWLAADRIARKKGQTAIQLSASQCVPGDVVQITIPAASASDLSLLEVSAQDGDRQQELLPVIWNNPEHRWEAHYIPKSSGETKVEASYRNAEGNQIKLRAGISVTAESNESVAIAARPELAAEIARVTGGTVLYKDNVERVMEGISKETATIISRRRDPVWDSAWLLLLLLALVMAEWVVRRRQPVL